MTIRRGLEWVFGADTAAMSRGLQQGTRALDQLAGEAREAERALQDIPTDIDIEIDADLKADALDSVRRRLRTQLNDLNRDINIDPDIDASEALREINRIERELRRLDRLDVDVDVDIDRDGRMSRGIRTLNDGLTDFLGLAPAVSKTLSTPAGLVASLAVLPAAL